MPHRYDESQWPVVFSWPIGESQTEDVQEYIAVCERALARRERHVVIMDATNGELLKPAHRRLIAEWVKAHKQDLATYRAGLGFVCKSAVVRGTLTATYWLFPPPYPYKVFAKLDEAKAWAQQRLRAETLA